MTALAGLWRLDGRPDAKDGCRRMVAAQASLGTGLSAVWDGEFVALGIDARAQGPRQTVSIGAGGRLVLAADIRMDNRDEVAAQVGVDAASGALATDADLLMRVLERWGTGGTERVLGDFAFVLWDRDRRCLSLVRDALGARPLHYHRGARLVAFSGMPSGLHALAEIPRTVDERRLADFIALAPEAGTGSFFEGINRVEPGSIVEMDADGQTTRRWWNPPRPTKRPVRFTDAVLSVRAELDRAVACRLGDGGATVASHLSAGLDSSAVAATAARLLAGRNRRLIAYTAVPPADYDPSSQDGRLIDEGPAAALLAASAGNIDHILIHPTDRSPVEDLDRAFAAYQRPVLNLCNIDWVHAINDDARGRGVRVMLNGNAGNFTLSYDGAEALAEFARSGRLRDWVERAVAMGRRGQSVRSILAQAFGPWMPAWAFRLHHDWRHGTGTGLGVNTALEPSLAAEVAARGRLAGFDPLYRPARDGFDHRLRWLRWSDQGTTIKGTLAMWGIDLRDPTADRRLVETCLALPTALFSHGGEARALARAVLADRVPMDVLAERRRAVQAAAWHRRYRTHFDALKDEVERFAPLPEAERLLDLARINRLIATVPAADAPDRSWGEPVVIRDHRAVVQRALSVGHFIRRVSGANR